VRRIICVGSSTLDADSAGCRVHARLAAMELPADVELIDGGLRGLDLLPHFENAEKVVLVDAVRGWAGPGQVVLLDGDALCEATAERYDHASSLTYLLRTLPAVLEAGVPAVELVGLEPPSGCEAIERAAGLAIARCHGASGGRTLPRTRRST
jgi:hydrogenase maturation protease